MSGADACGGAADAGAAAGIGSGSGVAVAATGGAAGATITAVATGAAEWALERWCELEAASKNGGAVDEDNKTKVGIIHLCGTGYATETGKFADAVNKLIREGDQDMAQSIVDATINA